MNYVCDTRNDQLIDSNWMDNKLLLCLFEDGHSELKWYEHTESMTELSKKFPNLTFCLHRDGEEVGDRERSYYRNGKKVVYTPQVIWPEFKVEDLK